MEEKFSEAVSGFLQQKLSNLTAEAANYFGQLQLALAKIAELEAALSEKGGAAEADPES